MKRLLAIGVALSAALALPGQGAASPGTAAQTVSATVAPALGVAIALDGTVSTGSNTVAVSVTRRRIGGVLIVTVAPTGMA